MSRYLIVIEATSTGFSAYSPDLPGCVATGHSRAEVEREMHDAIEFHIEGLRLDDAHSSKSRDMSKSYDIDAVISGVRSVLPSIIVVQTHQTHPTDDAGLWCFRLPNSRRDIQIESSTHDCPFLVEHDEMISASEAFTVASVPEAVVAVVSYLRAVSGVP